MSTAEWSWPGARWWRCDLHVHTPASYDYTKQDSPTFADWAAGVVASGVKVVAVTDHNSPHGIDEAKAALSADVTLFPGVELTVSPGVHLLALFDPARGRDQISSLLATCAIAPGEWGERGAVSPKSVLDAMEEARKLGALCILAHVDADSGVLKAMQQGEPLRRALRSGHLSAVEVKHDDSHLLKFVDGTISQYVPSSGPLTLLRSSDAHAPGDIGLRTTWIKMTRPTLAGLRLALQDGPLSVRDPGTDPDPNQYAEKVLESLTVENTRYIGRSQPFTLQFNPWLNAVIGGRGTGKSSLLELTRAALRHDLDPKSPLRGEWDQLMRVYESRSARGILTADSRATVIYRKDGARFRIQWDVGGELPPIEEERPDGTWTPSPGLVSERFPVRIYSQKQVYELTREPGSLLQIVDQAPEVASRTWRESWCNEEARFLSLRAQAREVESTLADEPRIRGELEDIKRKLAVFEGAGHADLLKRWQQRRRQGRAVDDWSTALDSLVAGLSNTANGVELAAVDGTTFDASDAADAALLAKMAEVETAVADLQLAARALADRASTLRDQWTADRAASPWTSAAKTMDEAYAKLIEDLREAGGGDPNAYGRLVQQRQLLEQRLSGFEGTRETLAKVREQAVTSLERLQTLRLEISDRRGAFLKGVLADNPFVRIDVVPLGALSTAASELRALLGREDGAFARDIGEAGEAGTLIGDLVGSHASDFERADEDGRNGLREDLLGRIDALKQRLQRIRAGAETANHQAFANFIQGRPPEQLDRLDAWFPGDTLLVSFKGAGGRRGFQPITQGSPGQRSAALLAFLLSHGDEPILLDQPEDDLDNQLVYDLIVQQLRRIKSHRQVVVVTHNANIVVNGDAEHVVALDVRGGQASQANAGGLQEQGVRDEICRVMEGGAEAFRERYRRIAHGGSDV